MARFCRYCGSPISEDARFCRSCGRQLAAAQQPVQQPVQQPETKPVQSAQQPTSPLISQPPRGGSASDSFPQRGKPLAQAAGQLLTPQPIRALAGAAVPGELDFGEVEGTVLAPARAAAATALSPVAGVFRGLGACLGGIFRIFTKPLALIGVLIFAALWYFLAAHGETVEEIVGEDGVRVLSFLTFAEGGADRELPGAVLGALGRGTVAAGVLSLFGGLGKLFRGIGALFTGRGEKRGVLSVLLGVVLGALFYFAFAGADASASTAMVGLSGAALSLEALGGGSGKLYDLAQSLTSKKRDGVRTAVPGRCDGLLTGLALGSLLAAAAAALLL